MIKSVAQHTDGGEMAFDRGMVCDGVDTECETADDHQAWPGEFANQFCGCLSAVFGWLAGAGDGDDLRGVEIGGSLVEEEGRRVGKREQAVGVAGIGVEEGAGTELMKMAKLISEAGVLGEPEDGVDEMVG